MRRDELFDMAAEIGVQIKIAKTTKDSQAIAIHLLNPEIDEVASALETAERDMFPTIMIHTELTWPCK